jgi:uncharacterized protein YndB with AHSA1/START domain
MDEFGTVPAPETVRLKRLLPGPVERVWAYLTDSEKRGAWLASGHMDLRVGGRVELAFRHCDLSAENTAPERFKRLDKPAIQAAISRASNPAGSSPTPGTKAAGRTRKSRSNCFRKATRLCRRTHRRLGSRATMTNVAAGWHTHLGILMHRLEGREPRLFWSTLVALEKKYDELLPPD